MSRKILIVDDEPQIIEVLTKRLEANQYTVVSAFDGEQGIEKAMSEKPDLIIIDIMMPNLDGGRAVRLLKSDPSTQNIPVLFLTAVLTGTEGMDHPGINIDGITYAALAKPFDSQELLAKIIELIGDD
ncbi:MAG: response regulator [Candidatus Omnitrophica bacterium]|nr:response regulator [Candidatus Omnitrophota bacterium]